MRAPEATRRTAPSALAAMLALVLLAGCATRAVDVAPVAASPAEFTSWNCARIHDERDAVQQRAADVAWAVDERAGNNILALGMGVAVFWPAMLALRPEGPEQAELARLKGRFEALETAAAQKNCPPPEVDLPAARAAALSLALGERLVYEDRPPARGPASERALQVGALRRPETESRRRADEEHVPQNGGGEDAEHGPQKVWDEDAEHGPQKGGASSSGIREARQWGGCYLLWMLWS
jgi:hypothetical protein